MGDRDRNGSDERDDTGDGPRFMESVAEPTESIEVSNLFSADITTTGSFDLRGVQGTFLGKLLQALPIPALLIDRGFRIAFANLACGRIVGVQDVTTSGIFGTLFPDPEAEERARTLTAKVFATRKPEVTEAFLETEGIRIWGRLNFRSLRFGNERFVLVLVEDLTLERKQILLHKQHRESLRRSHDELEKRVEERTAELRTINERLEQEIAIRKDAEAKIKASLREKEILLQEIHHRVKNNLHIISSLLALQGRHVADAKVQVALKDSQHRVRSMAMIHEQLYQSPDLARIDFGDYLRDLTGTLLRSYTDVAGVISVNVIADQTAFDIETAIPCGLIVNELVSNCLKHAFVGRSSGEIKVELHRNPTGRFGLVVSDNGNGLPPDLDIRKSKSLGLRLVHELAEMQLHGELEVLREPGTEFRVYFTPREPVHDSKGSDE